MRQGRTRRQGVATLAANETDSRFQRELAAIGFNAILRAITDWSFAVLQPPLVQLVQLVQFTLEPAVALEQHRAIVRVSPPPRSRRPA